MYGKKVQFVIPRNGDIIQDIYLINLPKIRIQMSPPSLFVLCSLVISEEQLHMVSECIQFDIRKIRGRFKGV